MLWSWTCIDIVVFICSLLSFPVDCIENESIIEEDDTCMRIINEAKTFHLLPDRHKEGDKRFEPRQIHRESKVYIIGGEVHQQVRNYANKHFYL